MAFTVTTRTSQNGTASTSHTVTLPDGSNVSGREVVIVFSAEDVITPSSSPAFTEIFEGSNTETVLEVAYRFIDGTEGFDGVDDTVTFTTGAASQSNAIAYLISAGHHTSTPPEAATAATGSGANADAPSVDPTGWATETALWIAAAAYRFGANFSAAPTNYTDLVFLNGGDTNAPLGTARRELSAGSEDPGTFTSDDGGVWVATTVAVRPAADVAGALPLPGPGFRLKGPRGFIRPWLGVPASEAVLEVTGTVSEIQDDQSAAAAGSIEITGTVAETQDAQTSTATGQLGYSGTLAETQDNQTSTATGTLGYTGTLAETQDDQTCSASGTVGGAGEITGTLAETQDDQTSTASGQLGYTGTLARTQVNQTAAAAGWIEITGTLAETQDAQSGAATGQLGYAGTLAEVQAADTATAVGWIQITGLISETQDAQTCAATGFFGDIPIPSGRRLYVHFGTHAITVEPGTHAVEVE